jgi:hypothetical protein
MNERLINDCAVAMAKHLVERLSLRDEEKRDAFVEFYAVCKGGIECYEVQVNRLEHRLRPCSN